MVCTSKRKYKTLAKKKWEKKVTNTFWCDLLQTATFSNLEKVFQLKTEMFENFVAKLSFHIKIVNNFCLFYYVVTYQKNNDVLGWGKKQNSYNGSVDFYCWHLTRLLWLKIRANPTSGNRKQIFRFFLLIFIFIFSSLSVHFNWNSKEFMSILRTSIYVLCEW